MSYFSIDGSDFSTYVNGLKVKKTAVYNSQTNAAGDTVVDYINSKRTIEVGIIPLNDAVMSELLAAIEPFGVSISYRNPQTNLVEDVTCIIDSSDVEYYTIQVGKVMYKALKLTFIEL